MMTQGLDYVTSIFQAKEKRDLSILHLGCTSAIDSVS
jgi:hypothetical protein